MKQEIEYMEMEALFSEPERMYVLMAQQGALRQPDQIPPEPSPLTEEERERRREKERERNQDRHQPHHTRRWLQRQPLGVAEGTIKLSDKELKAEPRLCRLKGVNHPGRLSKS